MLHDALNKGLLKLVTPGTGTREYASSSLVRRNIVDVVEPNIERMQLLSNASKLMYARIAERLTNN